jgi:anti-anti-sigma factor
MSADYTDYGTAVVLRLEGDLDERGVDGLRSAFLELLESGHTRIVVNLEEVRFVSYMSLGVMVERLRKVRAAGGDIKLTGANLYVRRMIRMVGLTSLFESYETEGLAVQAFQEAA